jgi:hypothetical protein
MRWKNYNKEVLVGEVWGKLREEEFLERLRREGVTEFSIKNFSMDLSHCRKGVDLVADFVYLVPISGCRVGWKELVAYERDSIAWLRNGYRPAKFGLDSVFAKLVFAVKYDTLELENSGKYILGFDFRDPAVRDSFVGVDNLIRLLVLHFGYRYLRERFLFELQRMAVYFLRSLVYWRLWVSNIDWAKLGNLVQSSGLVQDYLRHVFELRLRGMAEGVVVDASFDGCSGNGVVWGGIRSWVAKVYGLLQGVLNMRLGRVVFEPDRFPDEVAGRVFNRIDNFLRLWGLPALLYHRKSKSVVLDMSNSLFLKIDGHFMQNYVLVSENDILHAVAYNRMEKFLEEFAELVLKSERILDEIRRLVNG